MVAWFKEQVVAKAMRDENNIRRQGPAEVIKTSWLRADRLEQLRKTVLDLLTA
ncbi:hypothetical protein [Caballeronia sp. 15715]|uniref:hypothetical protein n=1 Tax=unclassified Caballeronia TaxID=2646786 RepID=UPI0039E2D227